MQASGQTSAFNDI